MRGALHPAWREYRRRWWLAVAILVGYLPVVGTGAFLLEKATGSDIPGVVLAVAWLLAYLVAGLRATRFPCPSCGHAFHLTPPRRFPFGWGMYQPLAKRCARCGLPKWSAPP